jgi:uncharacterized protein (DUF302 family)
LLPGRQSNADAVLHSFGLDELRKVRDRRRMQPPYNKEQEKMFRIIAGIICFGMVISSPAFAESHMITKKSSHNVKVTLDRLEAALKEKGITVAARWDHAAAAKSVDMKLRPMEVIIFGNPKLGTPLMQSNPQAGIDLPLKVLAWEDDHGQTWLGYTRPDDLASRYGITDRAEVVGKINAALDGLTSKAAAP